MNRGVPRTLLGIFGLVLALASYVYLRPTLESAPGILEVREGWVRLPPPGAEVAAAYLSLHNGTDRPLRVRGLYSDIAAHAEIHDMEMRDGMMRMRPLADGLPLAVGETVRLVPGGLHVMLMGLQRPLQDGETITLNLQLADGQTLITTLPVQAAEPAPP